MTKRELIKALEDYPNDSTITLKDSTNDSFYGLCFISWKNSSERVIFNLKKI